MSLFNRFTRAVRARAGAITHGSLEDEQVPDDGLTHDAPPARADRPVTRATFAPGDRVIAQDVGFAQIVGIKQFELDGLPRTMFDVQGTEGNRLVPEPRAAAIMRHLVGAEGAAIAKGLVLAEEPPVGPGEIPALVAGLREAWQRLDLGPEAQAVRRLAPHAGELAAQEAELVARVRRVVGAEIEHVLQLEPGTIARELDRLVDAGR